MSPAPDRGPRRRLGIYLADQSWERTQSKGIYRYFASGAEEETYTLLEKVLARVMSGK